jgi:hypothetical protein
MVELELPYQGAPLRIRTPEDFQALLSISQIDGLEGAPGRASGIAANHALAQLFLPNQAVPKGFNAVRGVCPEYQQ